MSNNNAPKNNVVNNGLKNGANNTPKNNGANNVPKNNGAPKNNSANNLPKNNSASKNNSVNNVPKNNRVNNVPKNNGANNVPKNNGANNVPKNNSVNNVPKNNSVNNVPKNNSVKNNSENTQILQTKIMEGLIDKVDELKETNKIYRYLGIAAVIIGLIIVGIYLYKNKKEESEVKVFIEKQISKNKYQFESDFVPLPKNGFDYSINFWFYLSDYYKNYNKWRHVLHKGTLNESNFNYTKWNELSQEIQEQSPGIWLHPNQNNLRLAFTVEISKDFCSTNVNESSCNEKNYCMWDGLTCNPKKEHAYTDMENTPYNDTDKVIIEYVDIENIPLKTMINIGFTLEEKILNVYLNGKLHKVKKFLGVPIFNREDLHFNISDTYDGIIYNFRYISNSISQEKMLKYYNKIPNVEEFSKKYRIKKFASMYMFDELIKTFFV